MLPALASDGPVQVDLLFDGLGGVEGHLSEEYKVRQCSSCGPPPSLQQLAHVVSSRLRVAALLAPVLCQGAATVSGALLSPAPNRRPDPQGGYAVLTTLRLLWVPQRAAGGAPCAVPLNAVAMAETKEGVLKTPRLKLMVRADARGFPTAGLLQGARGLWTCVDFRAARAGAGTGVPS